MSQKHKMICAVLNYIEQFLILASKITKYVSTSAFTSLICIPLGITGSEIGLKICELIAGTKKYRSIVKKRKHNKIISIAKSKLNRIKVLFSKSLIDWNISHNEIVLIKNVLNEHEEMKEEIKN